MHLVGLEPTTSPSILLLQGEKVSIEPEFIGLSQNMTDLSHIPIK